MNNSQYDIQTQVFKNADNSLQACKHRLIISGILNTNGTWNKHYSFLK